MAKWLILMLIFVLALLLGCNIAKDTAQTSEKGGAGAVGVAEKMKGGTVGETDEDSGESTQDTGESTADSEGGE